MCTSLVPLLCSSDGPSTPFGNPVLAVADLLRIACAFGGLLVAATTPGVTRRAWTELQRWRLISIGLFALVAGGTELEHLGDWPSYRLLLNIAAVGFAAWGYRLDPRHLTHRRDR